jgi:hypothetical protein
MRAGKMPMPSAYRQRSRLFEIAGVLVRFNQVATFIVNANHSIM